jgi:hypothetical protein
MFWLIFYYVCRRFYRALCKSVRCPDMSVDTNHAKCGFRDLTLLLYLLLLLVEAASLIWNVIEMKVIAYCIRW